VADFAFKTVTIETKELIKKALLERNPLRGICRIFDVSLTWLLAFVAGLYAVLPADLGINLQNVGGSDAVSLVYPGCRSRRNVEFRYDKQQAMDTAQEIRQAMVDYQSGKWGIFHKRNISNSTGAAAILLLSA
jgi:hypothetical protein